MIFGFSFSHTSSTFPSLFLPHFPTFRPAFFLSFFQFYLFPSDPGSMVYKYCDCIAHAVAAPPCFLLSFVTLLFPRLFFIALPIPPHHSGLYIYRLWFLAFLPSSLHPILHRINAHLLPFWALYLFLHHSYTVQIFYFFFCSFFFFYFATFIFSVQFLFYSLLSILFQYLSHARYSPIPQLVDCVCIAQVPVPGVKAFFSYTSSTPTRNAVLQYLHDSNAPTTRACPVRSQNFRHFFWFIQHIIFSHASMHHP